MSRKVLHFGGAPFLMSFVRETAKHRLKLQLIFDNKEMPYKGTLLIYLHKSDGGMMRLSTYAQSQYHSESTRNFKHALHRLSVWKRAYDPRNFGF